MDFFKIKTFKNINFQASPNASVGEVFFVDTSRVGVRPSNLLEVIFHMVFLVILIGLATLLFFAIYHLNRRRQAHGRLSLRRAGGRCWGWLPRGSYCARGELTQLANHQAMAAHSASNGNTSNVICFASSASLKRLHKYNNAGRSNNSLLLLDQLLSHH